VRRWEVVMEIVYERVAGIDVHKKCRPLSISPNAPSRLSNSSAGHESRGPFSAGHMHQWSPET
jgi:hypothetical protein